MQFIFGNLFFCEIAICFNLFFRFCFCPISVLILGWQISPSNVSCFSAWLPSISDHHWRKMKNIIIKAVFFERRQKWWHSYNVRIVLVVTHKIEISNIKTNFWRPYILINVRSHFKGVYTVKVRLIQFVKTLNRTLYCVSDPNLWYCDN